MHRPARASRRPFFATLVLASLAAFAMTASTSACGGSKELRAPQMALSDTGGGRFALPDDLSREKATVLVFYSDHCPCFRVHEDRIRAIASDFGGRGVRVVLVDSEVEAELERDAASARERNLPPIVVDPGAKLAGALGAEYATYSVVFDGEGRVRYRGGIDSDKNRLTPDARPYLREAVEAVLAGKEPPITEGKALGCALQTH